MRKSYLFFIVCLAAILCFSQDSSSMWDGLYLINSIEKSYSKDKTTVFDFQGICIIDSSTSLFYSRMNFRQEGDASGGAVWGVYEIDNERIYVNIFRSGIIRDYYIEKPFINFSISDCSGPECFYLGYAKLFPISN